MTEYVIFRRNRHDASISTMTIESVFSTKELASKHLSEIAADLKRSCPTYTITKDATKVSCDRLSYYYEIKKVNYDLFSTVYPDEYNNNHAIFGDLNELELPKEPVVFDSDMDRSLDELEVDCWKLIKSYVAAFDCKLIDEDSISFDLVKQLQNYIIQMFVSAGIRFYDRDHNVIF